MKCSAAQIFYTELVSFPLLFMAFSCGISKKYYYIKELKKMQRRVALWIMKAFCTSPS